MRALRRDRVFAGGLPVRHARQSRHFRTDEALAGSIAANSAALTSAIRPSLGHAPGNRDEAVRLIRLQPHEFEVLAQRFLVLTEAFADLAQDTATPWRRRAEPSSGSGTAAWPW